MSSINNSSMQRTSGRSSRKGTAFPSDTVNPCPGATLAGIRAEKGIAADYVQRQLGLTGSLFAALEADDHLRLPAPVYVKGYLRRYAELMDVRPAPVLASYQRLLENLGLVDSPVVDLNEYRPVKAIIASALALLLGTSLVFGAMLSDSSSHSDNGDAEITASADEATRQVETAENTEATAAAESPFGVAVESAAIVHEPAQHQLQLDFTTDSWVEIVDAEDHILAVSLQRAGDHLDLEGVPPFKVTLGYGPGVRLTYLDEPVALQTDPETFAVEMFVGK